MSILISHCSACTSHHFGQEIEEVTFLASLPSHSRLTLFAAECRVRFVESLQLLSDVGKSFELFRLTRKMAVQCNSSYQMM